MNRYIFFLFCAAFSLHAMTERRCILSTCDGIDSVLVCMNDYFCCANTPCAYLCEKCFLQVIDKQRFASAELGGGSPQFYCPICAAPYHSQIVDFYATLMVGLKRKFPRQELGAGNSAIVSELALLHLTSQQTAAHCFICDETGTKELVYTNDFFNCDTDPCAIYCRKCLINALKRQTRSISFKAYCNKFRCPVCWSDINARRSKVFLGILQDYRRKIQQFRFDDDEFTIYNDFISYDPASKPVLQQDELLLQEALITKHSGNPETCECCMILDKLRKTANNRTKIWQYFIVSPLEAGVLLRHNKKLMAKLLRNYSDKQKEMLATVISNAYQKIEEDESHVGE